MKLYVVVDGSLPPGDQVAQTLHAGLRLAHEASEALHQWVSDSNTVVCLTTSGPVELQLVRDRLMLRDITFHDFREPDLDNRLTALAFVADKNPCGNLPLAPRIGSSKAEQ